MYRPAVLLGTLLFAAASFCGAQTPYRPSNLPDCGGMRPGSPPKPATGGTLPDGRKGTIFLRVVDAVGNDFEIYCVPTFGGAHYEYWASFPGGAQKIDECEYDINDIVLQITGGVTATGTLPNGGQSVTVGGIGKYYHENWDQTDDYHATFDYVTKRYIRVNTKHRTEYDEPGKLLSVNTSPLGAPIPVPDRQPARREEAAYPEPKDDPRCIAGTIPEGLKVVELDLGPNQAFPDGATLFAAPGTPVRAAAIDRTGDALVLTLTGAPHREVVSVAFPRTATGRGAALSEVLVDGGSVAAEETVTGSHRTLTFGVARDARRVVIRAGSEPAGGGPQWLWLAVAAIAGVLCGLAIPGLRHAIRTDGTDRTGRTDR